jgi:ribonuclease T2
MKKITSLISLLILNLITNLAWAELCDESDNYNILALTWLPGYCVSEFNKPICNSNFRSKINYNFIAHGLWMSNKNCTSKYNFCKSEIGIESLSEEVKMNLMKYMTSSNLKKDFIEYQWKKHGSCSGQSPDEYFSQIISLTKDFNRSSFKINLMTTTHAPKNIPKNRFNINQLFEQNFGTGTSKFMSLKCDVRNGKKILKEIQLSLPSPLNNIPEMEALRQLIPQSNRDLPKGNCGNLFFLE